MKNLILIFGFILGFMLPDFYCYAQAESSPLAYQSASQPTKKTVASPGKLVAIVTQSFDNKFSVGVHVENHEEGKFTVKLKSSNSILHKEVVKNKTYVRRYDMFNLPVGDYEIEVESEKEVFTKKITINKSNGVRVLSIL